MSLSKAQAIREIRKGFLTAKRKAPILRQIMDALENYVVFIVGNIRE